MADNVFVREKDEKGKDQLTPMGEKPFESEKKLQELLARFPDLLLTDAHDSNSPRHWLLIKREMGIPDEEEGRDRLRVDLLLIDQHTMPTFVEVKLGSNPDLKQRTVVGQMLDYAANAFLYWGEGKIHEQFEKTHCDEEDGAENRLADFLRKYAEDEDPDNFWQRVNENLKHRYMRMLFVADAIPPELRRVVKFLNETLDGPEVLAVEIKQYVHVKEGTETLTLVPRIIGRTTEAGRPPKGDGCPPPPKPTSLVWLSDPQRTLPVRSWRALLKHVVETALSHGLDPGQLPMRHTFDNAESEDYHAPEYFECAHVWADLNAGAPLVKRWVSKILERHAALGKLRVTTVAGNEETFPADGDGNS
jgi:hypothetical protein